MRYTSNRYQNRLEDASMPGKITFHFDDGHFSHYNEAFPVFRELGVPGCLALLARPDFRMGFDRALEMQEAGWEILCHSVNHIHMNTPLPDDIAYTEIVESRRILEEAGFRIRTYITPMSVCDKSLRPLLEANYDSAFTCYTNSAKEPVENLVISRPVNRFELHRAGMSGKSLAELCAFVDYVVEHDAWIVFYEHDLGDGKNITADMLRELILYCKSRGAAIVTSSEALDSELCRTKILREGYDGQNCFVHARIASDGGSRMLITSQKMDVRGSDCFELLQTGFSRDGGHSWSGLTPDEAFKSTYTDDTRAVCCDMTPFYHRKTGKFLVTGHTAQYHIGSLFPVNPGERQRVTPYAVYNEETGKFSPVRHVEMPDPEKYQDCGSGCSQIYELENGELLIPIAFGFNRPDGKRDSAAAVMRCSFDGEMITVLEVGADIEVPNEVRGIGECSVMRFGGRFYLTIRGDTYGYVSVSDDGLNYTAPAIWRWEDGEIVPTYNTQSHWFTSGGNLYLVYTRKNGHNDHVFRHRAPLYAARVNTEKLALVLDSEFIAVPERGARLGNFGVCTVDDTHALVLVSEWMQPVGCERYGSDNAIWLSDITIPPVC